MELAKALPKAAHFVGQCLAVGVAAQGAGDQRREFGHVALRHAPADDLRGAETEPVQIALDGIDRQPDAEQPATVIETSTNGSTAHLSIVDGTIYLTIGEASFEGAAARVAIR